MPTLKPTGNPKGRPQLPLVHNQHRAPCHVCGNLLAISWRVAEPDDGAPMEPFMPLRWFCSGERSGGVRACLRQGNRAGAVVVETTDVDPQEELFPETILGISKDASVNAAKSAYRNLSKKWHPDNFCVALRVSRAMHAEDVMQLRPCEGRCVSGELRVGPRAACSESLTRS